jgi:hypothetical protein
MNRIKNFVCLAVMFSITGLFNNVEAKENSLFYAPPVDSFKIAIHVDPQSAAFMKIEGIKGECKVAEGRNTVATNTRTGDKYIIVVKSGKLTECGLLPANGRYKILTPTSTPCNSTIHCTTMNPPKCFVENGVCFCVCGPWISAAATRN